MSYLLLEPTLTKLVGVTPTSRGTYTGIASDQLPDCAGDVMKDWVTPVTVPILIGHDPRRMAVGKAKLTRQGNVLVAELDLVPPGTSADADEARRIIEAGAAQLSIGFRPIEPGKLNSHGGLDYPKVEVLELSLVGAGCVASAGVPGGKCKCTTTAPAAAGEQLFLVDPTLLVGALKSALTAAIEEELARAAGALDAEGWRAQRRRKAAMRTTAAPMPFLRGVQEERPERLQLAPDPIANPVLLAMQMEATWR